MQPDEPASPPPGKKREDVEERRRRKAERREGVAEEAVEGVADAASSRRGRGSGCDCDTCDVCDFLLFVRLSSVLLRASMVLPEEGGQTVVRALLRAYRRWFTRFTPTCPSTPSCSTYAVAAVESLGVRRGLAAAAHQVHECGSTGRGIT